MTKPRMKKAIFALFGVFLLTTAFAQEKPEGLFINSRVPDFKATDQNDMEVNFKDLRKKGNVVVVFYRGTWCPYCTRYLKKLQDSLELITAKGAQLLVITPQNEDGIDSAVAKSGARFPIVSDKDLKLSRHLK